MKTLTFIKTSSILVASIAFSGALLAAPVSQNADSATTSQSSTTQARQRVNAAKMPTAAEQERYDVNTVEKMDEAKSHPSRY